MKRRKKRKGEEEKGDGDTWVNERVKKYEWERSGS